MKPVAAILSTALITLASAAVGAVGFSTVRDAGQPSAPAQGEVIAAVAASTPVLPVSPCPDDDSNSKNCFWDAARQGNGEGHSYWVDAHGKVTYLDPSLNDPADRAEWDASKQAAGWEDWGTVFGHRLCWAKVGDTSYIECFDGFRETS